MNQECCGRQFLTPFCPFCGRSNSDPLLKLVEFLREKESYYRKQAENSEKLAAGIATGSGIRKAKEADAAKNHKKADQFVEWCDLILALSKLQITGTEPS